MVGRVGDKATGRCGVQVDGVDFVDGVGAVALARICYLLFAILEPRYRLHAAGDDGLGGGGGG
jgi:hypothetical protein